MWEALGAIGTLAGGLGSLAGGLGIGSGQGGDGLKGKGQKKAIKNYWRTTMQMAREHNIAPLAALGVNTGVSPGWSSVGNRQNFAQMGQGLERALKGIAQFNPRAKELNRILLEQEKEKLKNMGLQNQGLMKQINDLDTQNGTPASNINITESNLPLNHPAYASGVQEGRAVKGLYQLYRHPDNTILKIPAEDAADFLSESKIDSFILQTKRWWSNLTRGFRARLSDQSAIEIRNELDDMENFMRQNGELRPDQYLQFSPQLGLPIVARSWKGKRKKIFRETNNIFKRNLPRYGGMLFRRNYN